MPTTRIEFHSRAGHALAGALDEPAAPPRAVALFAHCFTCSKDVKAATFIARELTEHGLAVLRFDFTGLGRSGGDFADSTFSSNLADLADAAGWLRENRAAPSILIGHSLGGAAVIHAARDIPEIKAVASISAPADPEHVLHLIKDDGALERDGRAEVSIGGRPFTIGREFVEDVKRHDPADTVASLRADLLLFHSPADTIVGIDNAARLYAWAHHPKSFVSLAGADHLLSREADARYTARVIAAWASRAIEAPE